jgi:hypothetical protein
MRNFWSNLLAGSVGAVLSVIAVAAIGARDRPGVHLPMPDGAVIPISGNCPRGWHPYEPAKGTYFLSEIERARSPETSAPASAEIGPADRLESPSLHAGARLVIPEGSLSIVLTLCQQGGS